jgi:hypothetical protein
VLALDGRDRAFPLPKPLQPHISESQEAVCSTGAMARHFLLDRGISIANFHMLSYRLVAYTKESVLEIGRLLFVELLLNTDFIR